PSTRNEAAPAFDRETTGDLTGDATDATRERRAHPRSMRSTTQALALASARHPWRTVGAWVAAVLIAIVAIAGLLGGQLTTEGNPTNNPESERADDALSRAFPADPSVEISDILVVHSPRYTVDAPQFRALVSGLAADVRAAGVDSVRSYLDSRDRSLVS